MPPREQDLMYHVQKQSEHIEELLKDRSRSRKRRAKSHKRSRTRSRSSSSSRSSVDREKRSRSQSPEIESISPEGPEHEVRDESRDTYVRRTHEDGEMEESKFGDSDNDTFIGSKEDEKEFMTFKEKILLIKSILGDRIEVKDEVAKGKKHRASASFLSDEIGYAKDKEYSRLCMPERLCKVFSNYYDELLGKSGTIRSRSEQKGVCKNLEFPPVPALGFRFYQMADSVISSSAPKLNENISSLLASNSDIPKNFDIKDKTVESWESHLRKTVHALGFADAASYAVGIRLKSWKSASPDAAEIDQVLGLLQSSLRASDEVKQVNAHLSLQMLQLRREAVTKLIQDQSPLQEGLREELRLSPESEGFMFPKKLMSTCCTDVHKFEVTKSVRVDRQDNRNFRGSNKQQVSKSNQSWQQQGPKTGSNTGQNTQTQNQGNKQGNTTQQQSQQNFQNRKRPSSQRGQYRGGGQSRGGGRGGQGNSRGRGQGKF